MTKLPLIRLYFDYSKRFELKQTIFLLKNKVFKKIISKNINNYARKIKIDDKTTFDEFRQNLNALLTTQDGSLIFIKNKSEELLRDSYLKMLKQRFGIIHSPGEISADLWKAEGEELETQNNFCRFHLFNEIAEILNKPTSFGKELILKWIELKLMNNKLESNSFNTTLRLFNWFKILISLPESENLNEGEWNEIKNSILIQTHYIHDNIELHIPGNHILIQYYILWLVSNLFISFKQSPKFSAKIENNLINEIEKEFLPDGLHFELSYHYHVQITQFVLMWMIGMKNLNKSLPKFITERISKSTLLVEQFKLPDGSLPMIGDNCYTFVHSSLTEDVKNIMKINPVLYPIERIPLSERSMTNVDNEYVISTASKTKLIADVGNLGYTSNPGHGHSDLLSFIYFDHVPLFIDPGTRSYENSDESLIYKKSIMHNAVSINGNNQAFLWGFFRWSFLPVVKSPMTEVIDNKNEIVGEYVLNNKVNNITHRRKFIHSDSELIVVDNIIGSSKYDVQLNFILSPFIVSNIKGSEVELKANNHCWIMDVFSKSLPEIKIVGINVYPSYCKPVKSNKINFSFMNAELPITLQVNIRKIN